MITLPPKMRILIPVGVVMAAALLLAGSLSRLEFRPGRALPLGAMLEALNSGSFTGFGPLPFDPFRLIAALLWLLIIVSAVLLIISPEMRREFLKRVILYSLYALIIYGLIRLIQPSLVLPELEVATPSPGEMLGEVAPDEPLPTPPELVFNPPAWLVTAVSVGLLAVPLLLLWLFWNVLRSPPPAPPAKEDALADLTRTAQAALDDLQAGRDLPDTVRRCYHQMSDVLARQRRLSRSQGMTPREFEAHLAASGLRLEHIQRLTRLFEQVRYGGKTPGPRAEREAVACLEAIIRNYGARR